MNKKLGILGLCVCAAFSFGACDCNNNNNNNNNNNTGSIDFEVESSVYAEVGNYFELPVVYAKDDAGDLYLPEVKVTSPSGEPVIYELGRFFVEVLGDYSVDYTLKYNESTITKQSKVIARDTTAPEISLSITEGYVPCKKAYTLPEGAVTDNYSDASKITQSVKVEYDGNEVTVANGMFIAENVGDYTATYSATDEKGNVGTKTFTVHVVEEEEGNITYWNKSFGIGVIGAKSAVDVSVNKNVRFGDEEYSLECYLQAPGYEPNFRIESPFISDLNEKDVNGEYLYDYVYFYAYTTAQNTRIGANNGSHDAGVKLMPDEWTKILITRKYANGSPTEEFIISGTGEKAFGGATNASKTATADNISDFRMNFNTVKETSNTTVYLSTMRAVKILTMATVGDLGNSNVGFKNEALTLPTIAVNADGTVAQKVTVTTPSGTSEEVTGTTYTPTEEGKYNFKFVVSVNDKLIDTVIKTVTVITREEGNITYFDTECGVNTVSGSGVGFWNNGTKYQDEQYSLTVNAWGGAGSVNVKPFITNLNEKDSNGKYLYDSVYFYAMVKKDGVKASFNSTDASAYVDLVNGEWTRIVLTRNGDSFTCNGVDVFAGTNVTADNITGFALRIKSSDTTDSQVVFSTIRATAELTVATVGDVCNLNIGFKNEALTMPTATVNAEGTVTQKVTVTTPSGDSAEVTGTTYTPTEEGAYTFKFVVSLNGNNIGTVNKNVTVITRDEGNITYFDEGYGSMISIGSNNAEGWNTSEKTHYGNERLAFCIGTSNGGGYMSFNPLITNLNAKDSSGEYLYNYVYFYARANSINTKIAFNSKSAYVDLTKDEWVLVKLVRDGEAFKSNGIDVFAGSDVTASNLKGFKLYIGGNAQVCVSAIRAAKTFVSPTVGDICYLNVGFKNEALTMPTATVDAEGTVTQKVTVITPSGTSEEVSGTTYIPMGEGTYKFQFAVSLNGALIGTVTKTVTVITRDEGNITYFDKGYGEKTVTGSDMGCWNSNSTFDGQSGKSLTISAWGGPSRVNVKTFMTNLNEKDSSGEYLYDYVYFYAKTNSAGASVSFNVNNAYTSLTSGEWTKIVLTRSGETFTCNGVEVLSAEVANNMTEFKLYVNGGSVQVTFSTIRACKTMPTESNE